MITIKIDKETKGLIDRYFEQNKLIKKGEKLNLIIKEALKKELENEKRN